ncbi:KH domain-containing protein [Candidatus Giovannonibacteria bacterium]|nr:KH domain-containing protein [Candidatus Giovannonibacteria bacterium]
MSDIEEKDEQKNFTEKTILEVLHFLGVEFSLEAAQEGEDVRYILKTSESNLLIGEGGQNLSALNHLVRRIVEKKYPQEVRFLIDVNDYHQKKIEEIKDEARIHAQRVRYFKKDIEMRPMNGYERRIVHMTLQEYPDITTESVGEGPQRRVVIKPFDMVS